MTSPVEQMLASIKAVNSLDELEQQRVQALGKAGVITSWVKDIASLPPEQRKDEGQRRNLLKNEFIETLEKKKAELEAVALGARLEAERVDVTLPARAENPGRLHPISQTIDEIIEICAQMGFRLATGPQIESDEYNFNKLNMPPDHPARQMQDTFYMPDAPESSNTPGKRVLRTHTSNVQIHTMLTQKPPIRIMAIGRTYRYDSDATHSPMFHQYEGLVIDEIGRITMAHLKGTLLEFYRAFFGVDDLPIRFRPSYFPFTEPSAEADIGCSRKNGEMKIGNYGDWLELIGCGMVHPKVLENCGIDSTRYQGFAWGGGLDRLAMVKYGIPDIRNFFESDIRWMKHYGFVPLDVPSLALGSVA